MPHSRSSHAAAIRRERALKRGYVVAISEGRAHIEVPSDIADRAAVVCKLMSVHADHCRFIGPDVHFAASAAVQAKVEQHS